MLGILRNRTHKLAELYRRFKGANAGNVSLLFGLTLVPLLGFIGGSIDFAYAYKTRAHLQNALDAAALAAGREMGMTGDETEAEQIANDVLQSNLGSAFPAGLSTDFNIGSETVVATANISVDTFILNVLGITQFPIEVTSNINIAGGTFEVVMALDNSGSMAGSKISDLRSAANSLVDILFSNELSSEHVTVGLVPFAAAVNVGTGNASQSWMDQTGQSSVHMEHFDSTVTRWDMFNAMPNVSWGGCVESRPSPHDVTDSVPSAGDTLFVPMFAPDEPDTSSSYINDYMEDEDGTCSVSGGSNYVRQRRTCKYQGENANTSLAFGSRYGPNHLCDSQPVQALTNNEGQITSAINSMQAYGGTNMIEGVMWGWRLLSPEQPFNEGKAYGTADNTKILILMSDGNNFHYGNSTHNQSWYSSYGYHAQGRLGSPSNSSSTLRSTMNDRTATACTNAKNAGVIIYTIALEISSSTTQQLLENCATSPARYFDIDNSDALEDAFEAIANEIQRLRIAS